MRAANMQALTNDVKAKYPGVVVYGIGDDAHKLEVSGHNEDDTSGVRAELSDGDNVPEHRAIDIMLGPALTHEAAEALVGRLVHDAASRDRLYYIIWNEHIWSRSGGWAAVWYNGSNRHTDHIHVSGWAADDENSAGWPAVYGSTPPPSESKSVTDLAREVLRGDWGNGVDRKNRLTAAGHNYLAVQAEVNRLITGVPVTPPAPAPQPVWQRNDSALPTEEVRRIQRFFANVFPAYRDFVSVRRGVPMVVDGYFGAQTEAWVKEFQRRVGIVQDGIVGPITLSHMRNYGYNY